MVLFLLCVKAELDGVESLSLLKKGTNLCFSVRNPLNDYEVREKIAFDPQETLEQEEGAREDAHHFALKWEGSKKFSTLIVLDDEAAKAALKKSKKKGGKKGGGGEVDTPRDVTSDDSGEWVPVLAMECRGLEPYAFHPLGSEFKVVSEGGAVFDEDVNLSEGDWAEYDEEHDASVSVNEFESKIIAV
jgi:hypothetical protein